TLKRRGTAPGQAAVTELATGSHGRIALGTPDAGILSEFEEETEKCGDAFRRGPGIRGIAPRVVGNQVHACGSPAQILRQGTRVIRAVIEAGDEHVLREDEVAGAGERPLEEGVAQRGHV